MENSRLLSDKRVNTNHKLLFKDNKVVLTELFPVKTDVKLKSLYARKEDVHNNVVMEIQFYFYLLKKRPQTYYLVSLTGARGPHVGPLERSRPSVLPSMCSLSAKLS